MIKENSPTAKQVKSQGKLKNGNPINVSAQFGQPNGNPRHNGAWKKEDTPRYKLEQMMKLPRKELVKIIGDEQAPYFERKIATHIVKGDWKVAESMMNQVYGQPKQSVETIDLTPPKPLSPRKQKK